MLPASQAPFDELPEALVETMLSRTGAIGNEITKSFTKILHDKPQIRQLLQQAALLKKDADSLNDNLNPTTCGIDGAYTIEKMLSTDLVAIASLAVEGLTPPNEKQYWRLPHHRSNVFTLPHNVDTMLVIRGIMSAMEL